MSSMYCTKIYVCRNADWCARDFNPKSDSPNCFEVKTRSEDLRAMGDEQLAEWLNSIETDARYYGPKGKAAWLKWLQEKVE